MIFDWDFNNYCYDNKNSNNNKINKKNNNKLQKKEQIPTEYNEEQTLRVIRKQDQIPGEGRRSKTINDMQNTAAISTASKRFRVSCR
jgi:hypothetical protein